MTKDFLISFLNPIDEETLTQLIKYKEVELVLSQSLHPY